jgi:hypothetical protein
MVSSNAGPEIRGRAGRLDVEREVEMSAAARLVGHFRLVHHKI